MTVGLGVTAVVIPRKYWYRITYIHCPAPAPVEVLTEKSDKSKPLTIPKNGEGYF